MILGRGTNELKELTHTVKIIANPFRTNAPIHFNVSSELCYRIMENIETRANIGIVRFSGQ